MARFGRATPQPGPTERRAPRLRRGADDYLATLRTSPPERYARASARAQAGEKRFAHGAGQAWETRIGEIADASLAVGEHSHLARSGAGSGPLMTSAQVPPVTGTQGAQRGESEADAALLP
jgi:hypothetical protein